MNPQALAPLVPLAERVRPVDVEELVGQQHLLGSGKPLRRMLEGAALHSAIFWGPPGSGKTTLARMIAGSCGAEFVALSAVMVGVKEIRAAVEHARLIRDQTGRATVLFLDEIHRFNKAQQDAFLPYLEDGRLYLLGATTENPSFELNKALLSRARVYVLKRLDDDALIRLLERGLRQGFDDPPQISDELLERIALAADGDARQALTLLELAVDLAGDGDRIEESHIGQVLTSGVRRFDKRGEDFYDQISALHKSVRGSDPDAALYWLVRMLDGGCDPLYVARRLIRMASEDIGNADPRALALALDACETYERLGSPEGELAIAQAVVFLACAAKSNAVYRAFDAAREDVQRYGSLEVPMHLRNAPTRLMKELGHGRGYRYAHDEPDAYAAGEDYLPEGLPPRHYYEPVERGLEQRIAEKLRELRRRDRAARRPPGRADDG